MPFPRFCDSAVILSEGGSKTHITQVTQQTQATVFINLVPYVVFVGFMDTKIDESNQSDESMIREIITSRTNTNTETGAAGPVILNLEVLPSAPRTELSGVNEWRKSLKLKVKARAVKGNANRAVIEFFANILGIPSNRISIISGERSRFKILKITGIEYDQVLQQIVEALGCGKSKEMEG